MVKMCIKMLIGNPAHFCLSPPVYLYLSIFPLCPSLPFSLSEGQFSPGDKCLSTKNDLIEIHFVSAFVSASSAELHESWLTFGPTGGLPTPISHHTTVCSGALVPQLPGQVSLETKALAPDNQRRCP